MERVLSYCVKLRWYHVIVAPIDPLTLGEPVRRARYYFILVRRDVAVVKGAGQLKYLAERMLRAPSQRLDCEVPDRLLPAQHPRVEAHFRHQRQGRTRASATPPCWERLHKAFEERLCLPPADRGSVQVGVSGLRSAWAKDAWYLLTWAHTSPSLVADVSQSLHRAYVSPMGVSPTMHLGRTMIPAETLLMANFPLHRMGVPSDVADSDLASSGRNTMHLAAVGLALCIVVGLVDWSSLNTRPGRKPSGGTPAAEPAILLSRPKCRLGSELNRHAPVARPSKRRRIVS